MSGLATRVDFLVLSISILYSFRQLSTPSSSSKAKPVAGAAITKFTKKLSEDEKRKQFAKERKKSITNGAEATTTPNQKPKAKPSSSTKMTPTVSAANSSTDSQQQPKKRVQLLMSVPRGQSIPQATKNNLISQFLAKKPADAGSSSTSGSNKGLERMDVDEIVVLDD